MGVRASIFAAVRFLATPPDSPFRKRISSFSSLNYVMHVTDQHLGRSLRFTHYALTECFDKGMLALGLYIRDQDGRPRLLTSSDNVFSVFRLGVAARGADHVR